MGGTNFDTVGCGSDANEAFITEKDSALWDHGHGGYTGTIAEKPGFKEFKLPAGVTHKVLLNWMRMLDKCMHEGTVADIPSQHIDLVKRVRSVYRDKWGPAVCFELTEDEATPYMDHRKRIGVYKKGDRAFLFCGIASE